MSDRSAREAIEQMRILREHSSIEEDVRRLTAGERGSSRNKKGSAGRILKQTVIKVQNISVPSNELSLRARNVDSWLTFRFLHPKRKLSSRNALLRISRRNSSNRWEFRW